MTADYRVEIPAPCDWINSNHIGSDETACFALARETQNVHIVARFTIDGEPVSKARARFTRRGSKVVSYTPEHTKQAEHRMAAAFRAAAPAHRPDKDNTYGVFGIFFAGTRQRRDVDNMLKLICDGLNGVAWADDSQVCEVSGRRGHGPREDARTEVLVYRVGVVERPTKPCENCGADMDIFLSTAKTRRFCNQACHLEWRRAKRMRDCATCRTSFDAGKGAKFCSPECFERDRLTERNVTVPCRQCARHTTVPLSWANKPAYCSDACREVANETCKRGHKWAEFGVIRNSGHRYCRECNRILAAARKANG